MSEYGCRCQRCDTYYKVDVIVPDELWKIIKPIENKCQCATCIEYKENGLLCGRCIMEKIENLNQFGAFKLVRI